MDNSQCEATCRNGTKCLNNKTPGKKYCWLHERKNTQNNVTNQ